MPGYNFGIGPGGGKISFDNFYEARHCS